MTAWFRPRAARPLLGALGIVPVLPLLDRSRQGPGRCEEKAFRSASCVKNEPHTHDTRKITLALEGAPWTAQGPIANVAVRVQLAGKAETTPSAGCCGCCSCPPPCGCPKTATGCCACCKCTTSCGCPKKDSASSSQATRAYNPLSATSGSELTLLVKRYDNAKVGSVLHSLKPGDAVEVRGPNQQWRFQAGRYTSYAMVAGGTGITPLFQCASHVLANDAAASVKMVTLNKTNDDVLLKAELEDLQRKFPGRLEVIHVVEASDGRPTANMLAALLPPALGQVLVMVCGRKEMTEAIAGPKAPDFSQGELGGILKDLGFSKEQVWKV